MNNPLKEKYLLPFLESQDAVKEGEDKGRENEICGRTGTDS